MNREEEMLEALQAYRLKPGKTVQFVNTSRRDACRLILEFYPAIPYYRVSYRHYSAEHSHLSGERTTRVTWRMFFIFNTDTAYVCEITSADHTPPAAPTRRVLKQLAANAKRLPPEFEIATKTEIASLWFDLKFWTPQ